MDDANEDRLRQHEDVMTHLVLILDAQHTLSQQQATIHERLVAAIEHLGTTQARIEMLLARMIERSANGRDA